MKTEDYFLLALVFFILFVGALCPFLHYIEWGDILGDYQNPDHQMIIREVRFIALFIAPLFTISFIIAGAIKFTIEKKRKKKRKKKRREDVDKVIKAVTATIQQQKKKEKKG